MPYTAPTPDQLQARYPAFASVLDATIQVWLTDAERYVDETWMEGDYAPAIMALAAHNMALNNIGEQTAAAAFPAGVTRFKSGAMDVTISDTAAAAQARGGYGSTSYGREFQLMLRRNFGGPAVVAAGVDAGCGSYRRSLLG